MPSLHWLPRTRQSRRNPRVQSRLFARGEAYAAQRKHAEAIKDYDAALASDKSFAIAVDHRGGERFKLGMIQESIDDFNTYLKAFPKDEPGHWRRGISFYYAGKYAEGAKQFYDGRVVFGADVENAFWHFLCNARQDGVEKARKSLLKLDGDDRRVPLMRVYEMLQGKAKPKEVIDAVGKADLDGPSGTKLSSMATFMSLSITMRLGKRKSVGNTCQPPSRNTPSDTTCGMSPTSI